VPWIYGQFVGSTNDGPSVPPLVETHPSAVLREQLARATRRLVVGQTLVKESFGRHGLDVFAHAFVQRGPHAAGRFFVDRQLVEERETQRRLPRHEREALHSVQTRAFSYVQHRG